MSNAPEKIYIDISNPRHHWIDRQSNDGMNEEYIRFDLVPSRAQVVKEFLGELNRRMEELPLAGFHWKMNQLSKEWEAADAN